jgi:TolB-like protein/Tfp pilus assembly protein PilF
MGRAVMVSESKMIYAFGPFRLDASQHLLFNGDSTVPLTPKAFEVLVMLVQNSGRILEKDKIIKDIWLETYVGEATLAQNIFTLRKALGDDQKERRYIETIPKRGYRFIAPVEEVRPEVISTSTTPATINETAIKTQDNITTSLAVLPFVNATDDPRADFLSEGIAESIINQLSQIPHLRVMARSTATRYNSQEIDARDVGKELGVCAVLVGRLLRVEDRLIIRTELVDVANGWQLWGEQFRCDTSDLLNLENEIAEQISQKLKLKLTAEQQKRLGYHHTENVKAYQFYLRGRHHWNERRLRGYKTARKCFEHAIALDPNFALAYSGLADAYSFQDVGFHGFARPQEIFPKARETAMKALELNDTLAEAHHSLAYVKLVYEWDWTGAESEFQQSLKLNRSYGHAHHWYSHYLMAMGRTEESIAAGVAAIENEPFDLGINHHFGWHYLNTREFDKAIEYFREMMKLDPNFYPPNLLLGIAYAQSGDFPQAIAQIQKTRELENIPPVVSVLAHVYGMSGQKEKAVMLLKELSELGRHVYVSPYDIARVYIGLGDKEQAFECLFKAYEDRNEQMCWLKVSPELETLRSDRRFSELIRLMGLPA